MIRWVIAILGSASGMRVLSVLTFWLWVLSIWWASAGWIQPGYTLLWIVLHIVVDMRRLIAEGKLG